MLYQQTPRSLDDLQPRSLLLEDEEVCEILNRFLIFRGKKRITTDCIRQIFMPLTMEVVKRISPTGLGQICAYGKNFTRGTDSYRDSCLVTHGTNAYSAVWLTPDDSGYVMLQKIATAALLSELIDMIGFRQTSDDEKVDLDTLCMPIHVFRDDLDRISNLQDRFNIIHKELGW